MQHRISPDLKQLAAALIITPCASIALYPCRTHGGYWNCHARPEGVHYRIDGTGRTPFEAIAQVAASALAGHQERAARAAADTAEAHAAYRAGWAASEGQPLLARFRAAEAAAAATAEADEQEGQSLWVRRMEAQQNGTTCPEDEQQQAEDEAARRAYYNGTTY